MWIIDCFERLSIYPFQLNAFEFRNLTVPTGYSPLFFFILRSRRGRQRNEDVGGLQLLMHVQCMYLMYAKNDGESLIFRVRCIQDTTIHQSLIPHTFVRCMQLALAWHVLSPPQTPFPAPSPAMLFPCRAYISNPETVLLPMKRIQNIGYIVNRATNFRNVLCCVCFLH